MFDMQGMFGMPRMFDMPRTFGMPELFALPWVFDMPGMFDMETLLLRGPQYSFEKQGLLIQYFDWADTAGRARNALALRSLQRYYQCSLITSSRSLHP